MTSHLIHQIVYVLLIITGCWAVYHLLFYFIKQWAKHKKRIIPELLSKYMYYPGFGFSFIISCWLSLIVLEDHLLPSAFRIIRHILLIFLAAAGAFVLMRFVTVLREIAIHHYSIKEANYSLRKAKTKFQLMQRVFNFLIIFTTISIILMTFSSIRQIGSTLLASAGVVGLVIGFAAQKSLGTLFAGLQIAIAQPIRIEDTVVVEDQFGTIGEITLTYVVVNCWDGRRLVVPINYFLEEPFENWTRVSPEVISIVKIYADYTAPVETIREQVKEWLAASKLWDKRSWGLVVTSASEKTIELRATMSTKDSGDAFDLACLIREKLINYLKTNYPECLPVTRIQQNSINNGKPE